MCCFSGQVKSVGATRIFARGAAAGRQLLAYQIKLDADAELAMILPLPVPPGPRGRGPLRGPAGLPGLLRGPRGRVPRAALPRAHEERRRRRRGRRRSRWSRSAASRPRSSRRSPTSPGSTRGSASPTTAWDALPRTGTGGSRCSAAEARARHTVHPMAFEFPRADPARLFFPTVHVHDGLVHARAAFDHTLYAQEGKGERADLGSWTESPLPAARFVDVARSAELVDGERHVHRLELRGDHENADVCGVSACVEACAVGARAVVGVMPASTHTQYRAHVPGLNPLRSHRSRRIAGGFGPPVQRKQTFGRRTGRWSGEPGVIRPGMDCRGCVDGSGHGRRGPTAARLAVLLVVHRRR